MYDSHLKLHWRIIYESCKGILSLVLYRLLKRKHILSCTEGLTLTCEFPAGFNATVTIEKIAVFMNVD